MQEFFENLKEAVATAERALLFTLGFEFNVKKPFEVLVGDPKTSTSVGRTGDSAGSDQACIFSVCLCDSKTFTFAFACRTSHWPRLHSLMSSFDCHRSTCRPARVPGACPGAPASTR